MIPDNWYDNFMKSIVNGGKLLIDLRDAAEYMMVNPLSLLIKIWLVFEMKKCTSSDQVSLKVNMKCNCKMNIYFLDLI